MLTKNESYAVQTANQLKKFIATVKSLDADAINDIESFKELKRKFFDVIYNVGDYLLNIILNEAYDQRAPETKIYEIKNYYYLYFLQQAARFNQFFNVVSSIECEKEAFQVISPSNSLLIDQLKAVNIKPFLHPLLANYAPTRMQVVLKKRENTFREHFSDEDGFKKFYNEKTTPEGKPHQDLEHYFKANMNIGSATQKSNLFSLFQSSFSQARDEYFKPADEKKHAQEKTLFASAIRHIQSGEDLTEDEKMLLTDGEYYRYPQAQIFKVRVDFLDHLLDEDKPNRVTHAGHASELIHMHGEPGLMLAVDPVNYQSGTEGFIVKWGASIGYPRKTSAALATDDYPATHVVLLTHNHHDHMCLQSLSEAFLPKNTLFIVPQGDARRFWEQGFENVIEFSSWNDYAEITLTNDYLNITSHFEISSFPAKHASNRFTNDLYDSLYMGFMLRNCESSDLVLCTGDTGVLDEEHFKQLENHLLKNDLSVQKACIASGPDRPRQWMECTHQSTADAITMHARLNVMNTKVLAKRLDLEIKDLPFETVLKASTQAIGYHQGCFRLGLLSLQDVRTTILRMLAVLKIITKDRLVDVTPDDLEKNIFYHFMDKFEQEALYKTIICYQELKFLTVNETIEIITKRFWIPQPGATHQVSETGIEFDYERLIQNRDPLSRTNHLINKAYEFFALEIEPGAYHNADTKTLIQRLFNAYLNRTLSMGSSKGKKLKAFLEKLETLEQANYTVELGLLYADIFPKQDEGIRDEGHVHSMLTILAGLIHFPEFRRQFSERRLALQGSIAEFPVENRMAGSSLG